MPLTATNFITKGPVLHADLLQFFNLFTGVMVDQPVTFKNTLNVGGSQGTTTVPVKLYGAVGQTNHLLDLYTDPTQANPGWGIAASGNMGWGPGGAAPIDTTLSRVATQNGHSSDTAGLLITPYLEVAGNISATTYLFTNGATLTGPAGSPLEIVINQDLIVQRYAMVGASSASGFTNTNGASLVFPSTIGPKITFWDSGGTAPANVMGIGVVGGAIEYYSPGFTNWKVNNTNGALLMQLSATGNLTMPSGNLTLSYTPGYILVNGAASASPYTQQRIAIYNDTTNWAYFSYGGDAWVRFVMCSAASYGCYFGMATGYNNTGTFTTAMSLTGSGNLQVIGTLVVQGVITGWSTINGYNLSLSTGIVCSNGNITLGTTGNAIYVQTNQGQQAAIQGAGDSYINYFGSQNGMRFMNYGASPIGTLSSTGMLSVWDSIYLNNSRGSGHGFIMLNSEASGNDSQIYAQGGILYLWLAAASGYVAVQGMGGGTGWRTINALSFGVQSALKDKRNVATLEGALDLVQNPKLRSIKYNNAYSGDAMIGFVADEWVDTVPEIVGYDPDGEIVAMDYSRVGAITFQALKEYIQKTDARIAELEARLAA